LRNRPKRSDDPSCIDLARSWLSWCREHHDECKPAKFRPTRLLYITSAVSVRLVDGDEVKRIDEPYIALSYCWGRAEQLKTTTITYLDMLAGIPTSELAATVRDVICVASELCIQYIWVDSLCIIQDDIKDWAHEASLMKDIYSNAELTVAASHGRDTSAGLFNHRLLPYHDLRVPGTNIRVQYEPNRYKTATQSFHEASRIPTSTTHT
jgi:hypothetical protein